MAPRALGIGLLASALAAVASPAIAQVPLAAFERLPDERVAQRLVERGSWLARRRAPIGLRERDAPLARWIDVQGLAVLRAGSLDLEGARRAGGELWWTPPRHLLLDRARTAIGLASVQAVPASTGQGVVIGIIDSGIDVSHPDLRHPDGTTRVAWWLDFGSAPAGLHPTLEAALGCAPESGLRCRVLSAADLDERLANAVAGDEPEDPLGHGTHVASIAAGNGLSGGGYAGVAPEATLVVARVAGALGTISDSDVLLATEFVYERAAELGMPAVVNLSLGSDFGPHDGSSQLERALADFVGPEWPGRGLVVAAGNSGTLASAGEPALSPLGIHAELDVSAQAPRGLTIRTPAASYGSGITRGSIFVWLNLYSAETLSVGLALPGGTRLEPISVGNADGTSHAELVAAIIHGVVDPAEQGAFVDQLPDAQSLPSEGAVVVLITGEWPAGAAFEILLEGSGRVEAWLQSEGDLAPEAGSSGASFARATAHQTITIPAVHPELVAVGASINRLDWIDARGGAQTLESMGLTPGHGVGQAGYFSSAGPNALGDIKPDLLAPGGFVIAAMAAASDPRSGGRGIFSGALCAAPGCQVVSDRYALTAGTSMASPMVSGAMALLLQQDPSLTQPELRGLLQAGTRQPSAVAEPVSRSGAGVLDAARALAAMGAVPPGSEVRADPDQSRLEFASDFVWSDVERSLGALLWLRDAAGDPFDASLDRLSVRVEPGTLAAGPQRVGPGLYAFRVSAAPDQPRAGVQVRVLSDGVELFAHSLPSSAPLDQPSGASVSGGWCSLFRRSPAERAPMLASLLPALIVLLRRRLRAR